MLIYGYLLGMNVDDGGDGVGGGRDGGIHQNMLLQLRGESIENRHWQINAPIIMEDENRPRNVCISYIDLRG